jgi:cation diffusion facilitator family transporter
MNNSEPCVAPQDFQAIATAARTRARAVRRVFVTALVLNASVGVMMAVYGYISHSLSVGTDSLHYLLDAGANLLALFGLHWSAAPADERHPYGQKKIEILAALGIGVLIVLAMFEFGVAAIHSLRGHAAPPRIGVGGFVVVGVAMVVNGLVARYEHKKAHELGSSLLQADAHHTTTDLYASGAVIASFLAVRAGFAWADGAATLVLVGLISHAAWEVFSENVPVLIDTAVLDPKGVIEVARQFSGVQDVHRVRSRGVHHAVELDLHLQVSPDSSLRAAHALAREIEAQLRVKFPELSDVVIHIEPGPVPESDIRIT